MTKGTKQTRPGMRASASAAVHRQMRQQSLSIPWQDFADACDQLLEWRSFALWVRAIIDAEQVLPGWLKESIDHRCPGFLEVRQNVANHDSIWVDLSAWIDDHFFFAARHGGWIDALHYYSGRDRRSEQVWSHWTRTEPAWLCSRPERYPAFDEWHREALKTCLLDAKGDLKPPAEESGHSAPRQDRLDLLVRQYIEWEAFAFWVRSIVESAHEVPAHAAGVLEQRCPGFLNHVQSERPRHSEYSTWFWRELLAWIESHVFLDAKNSSWLDAVRRAARTHLRGERIADYWAACNSLWGKKPPASYPTFEQWLKDADAFVTK